MASCIHARTCVHLYIIKPICITLQLNTLIVTLSMCNMYNAGIRTSYIFVALSLHVL